MAEPISSERLIVVPHRPHFWPILSLVVLALVISAGFVSYRFGGLHAADQLARQDRELMLGATELGYCIKDSEQLRFDVANLKLQSQMDKAAAEEVRSEVVRLRGELALAEENVSFYRGLLSPSEDKQGLSIGDIVLTASEMGLVQYRVVMQQAALNHRFLKGTLRITVVGLRGENTVTLLLRELDDNVDSDDLKMGFKYFQVFEGWMKLPNNFSPVRIELTAKTSGKKPQTVSGQYDWLVEEN